jgi:hypothetical protein
MASCNITTVALNYPLIIHTHEVEWGTKHWFYRVKESALEEDRRSCVCAPVNVKARESNNTYHIAVYQALLCSDYYNGPGIVPVI